MKKFIEMQKNFLAKTSELLKEEKFEEVVKSLELHSQEITTFEKSFDEEQEEIAKKTVEGEKEEIEKSENEEKARLKKYAEIFANADDLKSLLEQFKEAQTLITKFSEINTDLTSRLEIVEKTSKGSNQPEEDISKKQENDDMSVLGKNLLG